MKYVRFITPLIMLIAAIVVIPQTNVAAAGYVNQADVDIVDATADQLETFTDVLNNTNASKQQLEAAVTKTADALQQAIDHSYSTKLGQKYVDETNTYKSDLKDMMAVVDKAPDSLTSKDNATVQAYVSEYNNKLDALSAQVDAVNSAVDTSNSEKGNTYLYLLIASVIIAIGAFVWAFLRPDVNTEAAEAQKRVAYASIALIIGAAITYFTYIFTSDGAYTIMYGPIVIGAIIMIGAIVNYVKTHGKPNQPPSQASLKK